MYGKSQTYEEYKQKQENGTLTFEDMQNLHKGVFVKEGVTGSDSISWYTDAVIEAGIDLSFLD